MDDSGKLINFYWNLMNKFKNYAEFNTLTIATNITSSLKGVEQFIIVFKETSLLADLYGNPLANPQMNSKAMKKHFITNAIGVAGIGLSSILYTTFGLIIGLNPFKSNPSFWIFIDMMQMLSYLPLINCRIPENLEVFLTEYFGISKLSIPFDLLPDWVPNPTNFLKKFRTDPYNNNFSNSGYPSVSFIFNFGDQLITWCFVVLFYGLLCLFSKIGPNSMYILRLKK